MHTLFLTIKNGNENERFRVYKPALVDLKKNVEFGEIFHICIYAYIYARRLSELSRSVSSNVIFFPTSKDDIEIIQPLSLSTFLVKKYYK